MKRFGFLLLTFWLIPTLAFAWWNDDWGYKKKITLDREKLKQDGLTVPATGYALVRLHTGNFAFFADLADKGKDIRVLAGDEKTPLKFFIEKLDVINELAFIWVKLPTDLATVEDPSIWLYYGNPDAVDGQDAAGFHDVNEILDYQFGEAGIKDSTAYGNNSSEATATRSEGGLIGDAAAFDGSQIVRIPATPSMLMAPATGWTVSTWVKIDQDQADAVVFQRSGAVGNVTLAIAGAAPVLEVTAAAKQQLPAQSTLTLGVWHQLAVTASTDAITLYVDGEASGNLALATPELNGELTIGADATGARGFIGLIDQFSAYKIALDANAVKFEDKMQGPDSSLLTYGEDSTPDGEEGESLILGAVKNVTTDGWVIIGILGVMFLISWIVMISKAIILNRVRSENKKFEEAYVNLGSQDIGKLNHEQTEEEEDFAESPLLLSFTKAHGAFTGSTIYRVYHVGVEEMNRRLSGNGGNSGQMLTPQAMNAVKASMDAALTRELQKLNSQMVLLTIAISGGPFLGLLGTVIGVMITFAAIAVSGEVNVNAIAPGIAGALTATVAGLAVAIPCLFGYNYLGGMIKEITADMHVFVDEFIAKLSEQHT